MTETVLNEPEDPLISRLDNLVTSLRDRARYFRMREQFPLMVSQEIEVAAEALGAVLNAVRRDRAAELRRQENLEHVFGAVIAALQAGTIPPGPERALLVRMVEAVDGGR